MRDEDTVLNNFHDGHLIGHGGVGAGCLGYQLDGHRLFLRLAPMLRLPHLHPVISAASPAALASLCTVVQLPWQFIFTTIRLSASPSVMFPQSMFLSPRFSQTQTQKVNKSAELNSTTQKQAQILAHVFCCYVYQG